MTQQKIGRYEIKQELGRGGMATVYKAYDPRFEREVALKVLPRELLHDAQFRVRFEREAKTIAALEHQAIVPVYDVGDEDGQPYFVMRCMTGGSLADTIGKGPMSLTDTSKIIERLAPALDEAHFKGIVHRDLKPGNILFDRQGQAFISDFGIAKMTQSQNATVTGGAIIGTPAYMSPEQAQGEQVDGRSDVYALGVIIYEMLSGTQPYQATTPMAVVVKQITDPVPHILDVNPNLPPAVEAIIEKAMAKNPNDRFPTAGELSLALSAVASGQSGEEALKNATITATRIAAARTRMAPGKTRIAKPGTAEAEPSGNKNNLVLPISIVGGILILCVLAAVLMVAFSLCPASGPLSMLPWCNTPKANIPPVVQPTAAIASTSTPKPTVAITATLGVTATPSIKLTATLAAPAGPTATTAPALPLLGGADKIAFIQASEIWVMNVDGTGLKQLTNNKLPKSNLQYLPKSSSLVFISGSNVDIVDGDSGKFDTVMTLGITNQINEFRVSPDGKQVAIGLNRQMYIVPFDLAKLKDVHSIADVVALNGCLSYSGNALTNIHLKAFRWSKDSKIAAWLFQGGDSAGRSEDLIRITDISTCNPAKLNTSDEFPGTRFTPEGYGNNPIIPSFDWDGSSTFILNTLDRNAGWGFLYTYASDLHKSAELNPIAVAKSRCCYRDPAWSPDGSFVFFAFQNKDDLNSPEQFYFVPVSAMLAGNELTPLTMPDGFFKDNKAPISPAFHLPTQ